MTARSAARWLEGLGATGMLVLVLAVVGSDLVLAIRLWASVPLTAIQTLLVLPWMVIVLQRDGQERPGRSWLAALRARWVHLLNILLLGFALAQKWYLLLAALGEPSLEQVASYVEGYRSFAIVSLVSVTIGAVGRGHRVQSFVAEAADHPARLMVLSFGIAAFLGGFLLSLPQSVHHIRDASFLHGLFTATSAVCVTGLTVNSIGSTYTPFGQGVIFALAQAGGLGIMALSASFAVLAGRRLRVKQSVVLVEMIDAGSLATLRRTLGAIVGYTFFCEVVGATLLYAFAESYPEVALGPDAEHPAAGAGSRWWWAIFHAMSAFCHAGFSLGHDGLAAFRTSWPVCLTVAGLIAISSVGFPVLDELVQKGVDWLRGRRPTRLSLHARVTLYVSAGTTLFGAVAILLLEWGSAMREMPIHARFLAAIVQSLSMRSAGFTTLDMGALRDATLLLSCVIMFVGAAPGSTGGGIKVTTLATLFAAFRGELRGGIPPHLLDRALPAATVRRAMGVTFLSFSMLTLGAFVLLLTESRPPLEVLFETVSAFATCGLSAGDTSAFSPAGKLVLIVGMFVGRIGPLTVALAMAVDGRRPAVALAEERVMIG